MKINLEWIRDWVDVDLDAAALADALTTAGLEVDGVEPVAADFRGVVVAEVVACEPHPDADRLSVCRVDDGRARPTVVCGASNVREGLKVALARVGASLPGGRDILATPIRGVESEGMLCSAAELGLGEDASGIIELPSDAEPGTDLRAYLALDDEILDIDLTPNRGDCFSVVGIAREVSASRQIPMRPPTIDAVPASCTDRFGVRLEAAEGCPRFVGRVIRNLSTGRRSPAWLAERLRRAGLRAIHPVVDVTNYVMLELGQPLHGYDLGKLEGEIVVRWGEPGERLTLLDDRQVVIDKDVVVIGDGSGAIGLAGIMGGQSTAVDSETVDVFLESAFFPPQAVAGRARRFGLHTDASTRFERGVDPEGQLRAIERATALLLQIAGGEPGPVTETAVAEHLPAVPTIPLRAERVSGLIGQSVSGDTIEDVLGRLGMTVTPEGTGAWRVSPPSFRFDLTIEEDLVEEIARLIGYDNIPAVAEFAATRLGHATEDRVHEDSIADLLVARGYFEIITYSFVDPDLEALISPAIPQQKLANPISREMAVMRSSLWPGLLSAAAKNLSRQQERLRLFEIGTLFRTESKTAAESSVVAGICSGRRWREHWDTEARDVDFFDVKGDVEALVELTGRSESLRFEAEEHPALRPGRSARIYLGEATAGWLGELHPGVQARLEMKTPAILFSLELEAISRAALPAYRTYSKFPSLRRDLAVVVAHDVTADEVLDCVKSSAGSSLQNVDIFDVYRGPGIDSSRKSIGLGLILQDTYRTLTDQDADRTVAAVVDRLGSELGAKIRN